MKVLRYGEDVNIYHTTCSNCNSELEYLDADTFSVYKDSAKHTYVTCPVCKSNLLLEVSYYSIEKLLRSYE